MHKSVEKLGARTNSSTGYEKISTSSPLPQRPVAAQKFLEEVLQIRMYIWRHYNFTEADLSLPSADPNVEKVRPVLWCLLYSKAGLSPLDLGKRYGKNVDVIQAGLRSVEERRKFIEEDYENFLSTYPHP